MNIQDFLPKFPRKLAKEVKEPVKRVRRTKKEMMIDPLLFDSPPVISKKEYDGPKHWKLAVTTVVNPHPMHVDGDPSVTRLSFTGKTTYLFMCEETGEFRKEEVEGVEPTDVDTLIAKVDASGPEYIVRQTGTYILMKKPQDVLPVR
jgi:hypothetical protein